MLGTFVSIQAEPLDIIGVYYLKPSPHSLLTSRLPLAWTLLLIRTDKLADSGEGDLRTRPHLAHF